MSWERELFAVLDDLEQQAEALYDAEREAELADRSRAEYQQVTLASRLMASLGDDVVLDVDGVGPVSGRLERMGAGWVLVNGRRHDWVVATAAVSTVTTVSSRSVPEVAWSPVAKLGLGSALRRVADGAETCHIHRRDGQTHDVRITRVGADFVETQIGLAEAGTLRQLLVAFTAIAAVQSRG